jgi:hypothetical protein
MVLDGRAHRWLYDDHLTWSLSVTWCAMSSVIHPAPLALPERRKETIARAFHAKTEQPTMVMAGTKHYASAGHPIQIDSMTITPGNSQRCDLSASKVHVALNIQLAHRFNRHIYG